MVDQELEPCLPQLLVNFFLLFFVLTFLTTKIKHAPLHARLVIVVGCVSHTDVRSVLFSWCPWDTFSRQSKLWKLKGQQGQDSQAHPGSGALRLWCDVHSAQSGWETGCVSARVAGCLWICRLCEVYPEARADSLVE